MQTSNKYFKTKMSKKLIINTQEITKIKKKIIKIYAF